MRARRNKSGEKLAYGLSLIFFGLLFICNNLGLFKAIGIQQYAMDWRNFFLYAGIIFVSAKKEKVLGLVLLLSWVILRFGYFIDNLIPVYSAYFWPVVMLIAGTVLLIMVLRK